MVSYQRLQGDIAVVADSAGLCMATNDMISDFGGSPANFCDLGGSAYHEQIEQIIHMLNEDPAVNVIILTSFGGIFNVDKLAACLCNYSKFFTYNKPIITRLRG